MDKTKSSITFLERNNACLHIMKINQDYNTLYNKRNAQYIICYSTLILHK